MPKSILVTMALAAGLAVEWSLAHIESRRIEAAGTTSTNSSLGMATLVTCSANAVAIPSPRSFSA